MVNVKEMTTEEIENFDWSSLSKEEKKIAITQLEEEANIKKTLEQANKLVLNSIYGSMASPYFYFYDKSLAETITLQGQDAIKYAEKSLDLFFHKILHKDIELLKILKEKCSDVILNPKPCTKPSVVYMDTDSVERDTIIKTNKGLVTIEELYNESDRDAGETINGHESVESDRRVLNWSEDRGLYYTKVKRVIRHKVTKAKWKLKTKSGKEIVVTNDHSMIVFRNGKKIEVKPSKIKKTDKILSIIT